MKSSVLIGLLGLLQLSSIAGSAAPNPQQVNTNNAPLPPKVTHGAGCIAGNACQTNPNPAALEFLLPVFISNRDFKSTAILVNSHSAPTYVDVILHDADGNLVAQKRVDIAARNEVEIDIGELLETANSMATTGSVQIAPATDGTGIGVIGQMSIMYSGSQEPSYAEYEPSRPSPSNSAVLRAVADAGQGSPIVGITSVTASEQNVSIQCFGTSGASLLEDSHHTALGDAPYFRLR